MESEAMLAVEEPGELGRSEAAVGGAREIEGLVADGLGQRMVASLAGKLVAQAGDTFFGVSSAQAKKVAAGDANGGSGGIDVETAGME